MKFSDLKDEFYSILKNGFFHVLVGNLFSKAIRFAASVAIVHILDKNVYGVWSYVNNIYHIILLFDGLGIVSGILQYCSREAKDNSRFEFLKFGLRFGLFFNVVISVISFLIFLYIPLSVPESRKFLLALSFVPMIRIVYSLLEVYLRSLLLNKKYGILILSNSIIYCIVSVILTYIIGIGGLIIAEYSVILSGLFTAFYLLRNHRSYFKNVHRKIAAVVNKKAVISFSFTASLANIISSLLYLIDLFMIGLLIADTKIIASYNVSTVIPYNLNIIPLSVMIFVYPYFAKKAHDLIWLKHNYKKLILYMFILNIILSAFLMIFAEPLIVLMFGSKYIDSIPVFRVLIIGYLIAATFRIPQGNLIAATGNVKANLLITIISGVVNIVLVYIFITFIGPIGAAYATLVVFVLSSVLSYIIIKRILSGKSGWLIKPVVNIVLSEKTDFSE